MKCMNCKKADYKKTEIVDEFEVPGGPTVRVKGLLAEECPKCGDVLMDTVTSARRTQLVLAALVHQYGDSLQIPGLAAKWMRKAIDLSATDWAREAGGLDPSTFSQAAQRNSTIDRYAALVLLCRTVDFIAGSRRGDDLVKATHQLEKLVSPEILKRVEVA